MNVGVLRVVLGVPDARSLKEKRRVVKSIKDRMRHRFNVSVSEVGAHDQYTQCRLGVAMVAVRTRDLHAQFDRIVDMLREAPGATLIEYEREML